MRGDPAALREASPSSGGGCSVLLRMTPADLPGWTVEVLSSHSKELTLRHLLFKMLLEELNQREEGVLQILLLQLPDLLYEFVSKLFQLRSNRTMVRKYVEVVHLYIHSSLLEEYPTKSLLKSWNPEIRIQKRWTEKVLLPPKRFIGRGHNDGRSKHSAPSWMEMQLPEDASYHTLVTRIRLLNRYFPQIPPSLVSSSLQEALTRLMSPGQGRNGKELSL